MFPLPSSFFSSGLVLDGFLVSFFSNRQNLCLASYQLAAPLTRLLAADRNFIFTRPYDTSALFGDNGEISRMQCHGNFFFFPWLQLGTRDAL